VRSLPQRNAFHTFNVDRHLLRTVANASELVRKVSRPDLLLVAALLHDVGKGRRRDHTELGVEMVERIMPTMGFGPDDTATVAALVTHHLLLPETATRRDLADPRTVANVADALQTVERLELLRALTEADSRATGPSAWSSWKAVLVDRLTHAVAEVLRGREPPPRPDGEERFGPLLEAVRTRGGVAVEHDRAGEFHRLRVAAHDRPGLFAQVTGTLVLHRVDVTAADAWTSSDGIAVEQFHVLPGRDGAPPFERVQRDLVDALAGRLDVAERLDQRVHAAQRGYQRAQAAAAPRTEVYVSNGASDSATMIDIRVPDGPAVLYRLSAALSSAGLDIRAAKVATLGHEVVDVFYVARPAADGGVGQIPEAEHAALRQVVEAAVARLSG
jgi:[protein-PII] uridylyltransferase